MIISCEFIAPRTEPKDALQIKRGRMEKKKHVNKRDQFLNFFFKPPTVFSLNLKTTRKPESDDLRL